MNWYLVLGGVSLLVLLVCLKRKYDPHNDAYREIERPGWHLKKAPVLSMEEYKKRKAAGERNE